MPFKVFANRADPDQAALTEKLDIVLHKYTWKVISLYQYENYLYNYS